MTKRTSRKRTSKRRTSRKGMRRNAMYLPAGQRVQVKGHGAGTVSQSFGELAEVRWDAGGREWVSVDLITDLLRKNSRKRTSRNPGTVASAKRVQASRLKKIQRLVSRVSADLHAVRRAGGPPLTIEEERRLDGIAIDAAHTREQLNAPHDRHQAGLVKRVGKALGYNY